jgi:oligogalacturonide lyase
MNRRALLASLPFVRILKSAEKGRVLQGEAGRYLDPATEFPVDRMTNPQYASYWPYAYARALAKRGVFFLISSDRGDGLQAFRYELQSGTMKQLTEAKQLHAGTVNLFPDDRSFAYVDGRSLYVAPLSSLKEREVYRIPDEWELGEGFSLSGDGIYAVMVEKKGDRSRLRLIGIAKGNATTLVEYEGVLRHPQTRPRRASVMYERDSALHLVNYDGQNDQKLGDVVPSPGGAIWAPDGRTVAYLRSQEKKVELREVTPDARQDKLIAPTSQYGNFARNPDGSVLVAASRSIAQPHILIMLKSVKRELTVCEHKCSNPALVAPVFSPTSQRIYFQSDRDGKPAIYSVVVTGFIEKTDTE